MLIYHPAFDASHCLYRLTALLSRLNSAVSWEQLRVLDFYYLFPAQLKRISPWPTEIKEYKARVKNLPDQYEDISSPSRILFDLLEFQRAAMVELVAKGIVSRESFEEGEIVADVSAIPHGFLEVLSEDDFLHSEAFSVIVDALPNIEFNGFNGLKRRSGLLEYVYDVK
ncbi:ABC-three component system middle component 5 [Pseudomonas aeruginosa]|uniref:ABC-three component system middle component 5 n=1 Tax=Pseudomonas aeruginosa TaxID=287 RepID=UPI0036F06176|nr:hypothetical protein [Pseudomonas aeruginosa]